jgi:hypothetical protein
MICMSDIQSPETADLSNRLLARGAPLISGFPAVAIAAAALILRKNETILTECPIFTISSSTP